MHQTHNGPRMWTRAMTAEIGDFDHFKDIDICCESKPVKNPEAIASYPLETQKACEIFFWNQLSVVKRTPPKKGAFARKWNVVVDQETVYIANQFLRLKSCFKLLLNKKENRVQEKIRAYIYANHPNYNPKQEDE